MVNIPGTASKNVVDHLEALWVKQEDRRSERLLEQEKVRALAARTTPTGHSVPTCNNCQKKGHVKEKCWARGGGAEGKQPQGWCGEVPCFLFISVYLFLLYLSTDTCTYCLGLPHFASLLSYLTLSYLIPQRSVTFRFFLT